MNHLSLDTRNILPFIDKEALESLEKDMVYQHQLLLSRTGPGSDFLGWLDLPVQYTPEELETIERTAERIRKLAEVVVIIGIGGSYLGARAVIEALTPAFSAQPFQKGNPRIIYAGQHISEDYTAELLEYLKTVSFALVVISKSGTTTEPAIAFRLLKKELEDKYGKEGAGDRIIAITDKKR